MNRVRQSVLLHAGRTALIGAVAFAMACGSETPMNPDDPATISLSISPISATVEQGSSSTFAGTASLGGNFSGDVTFAVTGLPAGVTVTVGNVSTSGNSATATVTIAVAASVAVGVYNGTVTATGSGVSDTEAYTLTVTAPPAGSYTMSGPPDGVSIQSGSSGSVTITLARTMFTEAVTLAAEGLPSNVTAAFAPDAPTGNSSALTLTVGAAASAGTSTVTVRGTSSLADVTITFPLTITDPPAGGSLMLDYSACELEDRPIWLAYSNGLAGTWTVMAGVNDVYDLSSLSGDVLGLATVYEFSADADISVDYIDVSPFSGVVDGCETPMGKTVNGTLAGSVGLTTMTLGGAPSFAAIDGAFQVMSVPSGPQPFVAYSVDPGGTTDRMLVLRNQDIADMGNIGTIDLTADGFTPAEATISFTGIVAGETGAVTMDYSVPGSAGMCTVAPLFQQTLAGTSFLGRSATGAAQASGELHVAGALVTDGTASSSRQVREAFTTLAARTITLPAEMPMPTITDQTGSANYLRLQAEFDLPAEYDDVVYFDYEAPLRTVTVFATGGVLSGSVTLTMPDFSALSGWDDNWGIPTTETGVDYVIGAGVGFGFGLQDELCVANGRQSMAARTGTFN